MSIEGENEHPVLRVVLSIFFVIFLSVFEIFYLMSFETSAKEDIIGLILINVCVAVLLYDFCKNWRILYDFLKQQTLR